MMNEGCPHVDREEGKCPACGQCEHEVVLNGACFYCGETELKLTIKPPLDELVPLGRLKKGTQK